MKAKPKWILIRPHLFKWWTLDVAKMVNEDGANIGWQFEVPVGDILTLRATFGGQRTAKQLTLFEIEHSIIDVIAFKMREMAQELRA